MTSPYDVAVLVGSLRKDGYSSRFASALSELSPPRISCRIIGIGDLPLYNQDLDDTPPEPWEILRRSVRSASAVLFVTPEYNRSVPGVLKNAIDIASRPYGQNVFDGKPAAIVSQTPGTMGGFGANHALRQSLVFLNMPTLPQPEVYLANVASMFDDTGALTNDETRSFLASFMQSFAEWIDRHAATSSAKDM